MVTIIRNNIKCKLIGLDNQYAINRIDKELSYQIPGYSFQARYRTSNPWDGRNRLLSKNHEFLSGFLDRVKDILDDFNIKYEIDDRRERVKHGEPMVIAETSPFKPREYQLEVVNAAFKHKSGIVKLPTGSGKTVTLSLIAGRFNVKTMIYVIGVELLYQMKNTLEAMYPNIEIGIVGDGHCKIRDITIATIWSAATALETEVELVDEIDKDTRADEIDKQAVRKFISEAEMYIFDECQFVSTSTALSLDKNSFSARYKFLFSGTPWRDAGDDIYIEGIGGRKIYDKTASWMIENNFLVPPKIYFLEIPTMKRVGKTYPEVYNNFIIKNEQRNDLIVKSALKMNKDGRKILILVSKIAHGEVLEEMIKEHLTVFSLDGRNTTEQRMDAIQAMKNGELDVLIASKIFDQGIDIPELDALILAGSGKSSSRALQRIGRVIRKGGPNKKDAIVVDFWDNCKYLKDHSSARKKIYETEDLFKIIIPRKD